MGMISVWPGSSQCEEPPKFSTWILEWLRVHLPGRMVQPVSAIAEAIHDALAWLSVSRARSRVAPRTAFTIGCG